MNKHTKKALLASVLSLILCVSMLIGTTFAWFTDSVTTGVNTIQSGTLDIVLEYKDANGVWQNAEGKTLDFVKTAGAENEPILWEPGCTYNLPELRLRNNGNLALKYSFAVTGVDGNAKLLEVIEWKANDASLTNFYGELKTKDAVSETIKISGHMLESAGNEYQGLTIDGIGITVFATQLTYESDSIDNQYDKNAIIATTAAEAQAALDNAEPGTMIKLAPGVNYGTLVFRQNAASTVVDITNAGGDAAGNEHYSAYEDITILGAEGAVVDQIDFQVGWIAGSGASYVDIKNLTVKGIIFSGEKTAFNMEGSKGSALGINGLTIVDCKMNDADGDDRLVFQQITGYKTLNDKTTGEYVMTAGVKNLTITDCEVTGAYMVIESRAMENLTITNNVFKGIKQRDMLITSDTTNHPDVTYTGAITITGNTSSEGEERFVRASLNNSDAVVVIKDNTIKNYMGTDDDYIKVEGGNNVTVDNNPMTRKYVISVVDKGAIMTFLQTSVEDGATVYFEAADYGKLSLGGGHFNATLPKNVTIECAPGATLSFAVDKTPNASVPFDGVVDGWTFKNVNFVDDGFRLQNGAQAKNIVFEGCTFNGGATFYSLAAYGGYVEGAVFNKCSFYDTVLSGVNKNAISIQAAKNITVTNCVFENVRNAVNLGASAEGEIIITSNKFISGTDRVLRITDAGAVYTVTNNVIGYNGDSTGELVKVTSAANATFTFNGNDWNGKTDSEVTAGMVGADYIIK